MKICHDNDVNKEPKIEIVIQVTLDDLEILDDNYIIGEELYTEARFELTNSQEYKLYQKAKAQGIKRSLEQYDRLKYEELKKKYGC